MRMVLLGRFFAVLSTSCENVMIDLNGYNFSTVCFAGCFAAQTLEIGGNPKFTPDAYICLQPESSLTVKLPIVEAI